MKAKYYTAIMLSFIKYQIVISQGILSPAGVMISHAHSKGGVMLSYNYMSMTMKNNRSGTTAVSDEAVWNNYIFAPQDMHMNMHMLMGMYGLTDRLTLMAMTDYITSTMTLTLPPGTVLNHHHGDSSMVMSTESIHTHATSGFGDLKLWAIYKLLSDERSSLVFSAGINIPTGKFDIDAGDHAVFEGERHPYMMQLGTGSLDFMPGLTYLKHNENITWSAQAFATIRPFFNSIGYHYGSDITFNVWTSYLISSFMSVSARLESFTGGSIQGSDPNVYSVIEPDANPGSYGGQKVNGYLGTNFYIDKNFLSNCKIAVEFGIPVYQNLNGTQLAHQYTLNAGITKTF
ncbi:MAG: transporter [Saprospiraceae bacterium]|uniref:Transporter n=1 Tax=Candidatus Opimibacter skivensis TaxID=2982028 RepID=A0A9D7SU28_9BACT|nr:transporter [Candidatus Opimibacter skivensis]